ncbi:unnamed protein product [Symbiodinium sp. CCMP2592]|nr:unnamed protein product [Symbiodinium sp. CCMP2592]
MNYGRHYSHQEVSANEETRSCRADGGIANQVYVSVKGALGMSQEYILKNDTSCIVKVQITEDPEALKTMEKYRGGVGFEFVPEAGPVSQTCRSRQLNADIYQVPPRRS